MEKYKTRLRPVLVLLSINVNKTLTKSSLGRKSFIWIAYISPVTVLRNSRQEFKQESTGTNSNRAMKAYCLVAYSPWIAQLVMLKKIQPTI